MNKKRKIEIPILPAVILLIFIIVLIRLCFLPTNASDTIEGSIEEPGETIQTVAQFDNTTSDDYIVGEDNEEIIEAEIEVEDEVIEEGPAEQMVYQEQATQGQGQAQTATVQTQRVVSPIYHKTKSGVVYYTIGQVYIPKVNINYPIISETNDTLMKLGITKYWGCNPNEVGNMSIVGHNYRNDGKYFSRLHYVTNGDLIYITDLYGQTLGYKVYKTMVVDPYDTSCTSQLTNGRTEVTLITCYNKGTQRFVVKAAVE